MLKSLPQGKRRRYVVTGVAAVTSALAIVLAISVTQHELWTALSILLVSLIGFHTIALLSFDCATCWRAVDYPWVLATFMAILIALTNIYEGARVAPMAAAQIERKQNYEQLIYALKSVITNDCHPKPSRAGMWSVAPEPYEGACDRIEHFLPQIENEAARDALSSEEFYGNAWGLNILVEEENAIGSWAGLYDAARKFHATSTRTREVIDSVRRNPRSPISSWAASGSLKYWYFALAFFLGLRLSKISAELMASVAAKRQSPVVEPKVNAPLPEPEQARDLCSPASNQSAPNTGLQPDGTAGAAPRG
jgi:hypothetical protein